MPWQLLTNESPILPIHAALLPTPLVPSGSDSVLFFCGSSNNPNNLFTPKESVVWNLSNNTFSPVANPVDAQGRPFDLFCAGHTFLSDGRLLIAGGTEQYDPFEGLAATFIFNPISQQLTSVQAMAHGRWYPTLVTLGNGQVFTVSGLDENGGLNALPEIYAEPVGWNPFLATSRLPLYAHLFLMQDGRVFYSGGYFDNNNGVMPSILTLPEDRSQPIGETPLDGLSDADSRNQAASVLLPPVQDQRVMIIGGGRFDGTTTAQVDIVDLKATNPTYTPAPPLNAPRMHHNAVLLPDRTVFVCNGSAKNEGGTEATKTAEIYDPIQNTWTQVDSPPAEAIRLYHSVALLLPDGSIVTAGGNPQRLNECDAAPNVPGSDPPLKCEELRLEIYRPEYMSQERPVIQNAPTQLAYGADFQLNTLQAQNIQWVSLIKPMATTHGLDTDQRLVDVQIESRTDTTLTLKVTDNPNLAPPGWYMLFITDSARVPSVASWVQLTPSATPQAVTVYADADFAGVFQSFPVGVYRADQGELNIVGNDAISSLRVPSGLTVRVCENEDGGLCREYGPGEHAYVGDDLNDKISLIEVRQNNSPPQVVTVYADADFAGVFQSFPVGVYRADQGELNIVGNDAISSLRVPSGLTVRVCENEDGGLCREYGPGEHAYVGDDLNDKISLIEVRQNNS